MDPIIEAVEAHLRLDDLTQIRTVTPYNIEPGDDLQTIKVWGTREGHIGNHVRPMFQLMSGGGYRANRTSDTCPDCYDFAYTWNCEDHPYRGLAASITPEEEEEY